MLCLDSFGYFDVDSLWHCHAVGTLKTMNSTWFFKDDISPTRDFHLQRHKTNLWEDVAVNGISVYVQSWIKPQSFEYRGRVASPLGPMHMAPWISFEPLSQTMNMVSFRYGALLFFISLGFAILQYNTYPAQQDLLSCGNSCLVSAPLRLSVEPLDALSCNLEDNEGENLLRYELQGLKLKVWMLQAILGVSLLIVIAMAITLYCFWKHFTSEIDGMSDHWTHGDIQFENLRHETRRVASETVMLLNDHIGRHEREVGVLEDYIAGVRFGLVEIGGFMRHNALNMNLRGNMFVWERSNIVLRNMRMRSTENTDMTAEDHAMSGEEVDGSDNLQCSDSEDGWEGSVTIPRMVNDLRRAQNEALARGDANEGGETQRLLVALLQRQDGLLDPELADDLFNFYRRAYRRTQNSGYHEIAALYNSWSTEIRDLVDWGDH